MPADIHLISALVNISTNLLVLGVGVSYCYRSVNPPYLGIFPIYLFISIVVELLVDDYLPDLIHYRPFGAHQFYARTALYNLYTLVGLFVFSWFLYRIILSPLIKKVLIISLILFCLFFIIYSLKTDIEKNINIIVIMVGVAQSLSSITSFSLVTYLLFIKGFTCRTRRS